MASVALIRAAARVTPRMALYRVKRYLRNRIAKRFPKGYAKYIESVASSVPRLDMQRCISDDSLLSLAHTVAAYYEDEYAEAINDIEKGCFRFLNRTVDFGSLDAIDWHYRLTDETDFHLWRQKLAHMGFMCPLLISGETASYETVRAVISSYRKHASFATPECFSSYWFPYSVSHRILAILSGYIIALRNHTVPEALRADIEAFLQWNVGFLLANVEHDLRNNHVERNLAALCLYFNCTGCEGKSPHHNQLDREVRRLIDALILPDGFSAERSAMYQGLTVLSLRIFSEAGCLRPETRSIARRLHHKAARAWQLMTHPDGEIALFNDSWFGEVPPAHRVTNKFEFAPVDVLAQTGYARLQTKNTFALMDAGPIGPRWCPGHGHADFLSLEVDLYGKRFIVDPGTYQYSTGRRRSYERSAASHNGPTTDLFEPVEYTGCFRVGRMSEAEFVSHAVTDAGGHAKGRLVLRSGRRVERTVELRSDVLRIVDEWFMDSSGALVRIIVSDNWTLSSVANNVLTFSAEECTAQVVVTEGYVADLEDGEWASHYLETRPATAVTLRPRIRGHQARLVWEVGPTQTNRSQQAYDQKDCTQ